MFEAMAKLVFTWSLLYSKLWYPLYISMYNYNLSTYNKTFVLETTSHLGYVLIPTNIILLHICIEIT